MREVAGSGQVVVAGATVAEVLAEASARFGPSFALLIPSCAVWVNGEQAEADRSVGPDDEVALIPPVSGGS